MYRVLTSRNAVRIAIVSCAIGGFCLSDHATAQDSPPPPRFDWTGLSLGAGIGAGIGLNDASLQGSRSGDIGLCNPANCAPTFFPLVGLARSNAFSFDSIGDAGVLGSVQVGYDRQLGNNVVVGAFADFDWTSDIESNFSGNSNLNLAILGGALNIPISTIAGSGSIQHDYSFSVGGRIGVLTSPKTLVYGLGAYTHVELEEARFQIDINDPLGFIPAIASPTSLTVNLPDSLDGYTIGGGMETKVTNQLSVKFEYRYSNLESESRTVTDTTTQCCIAIIARQIQEEAEASLDMDLHSVRAVLAWRPNLVN